MNKDMSNIKNFHIRQAVPLDRHSSDLPDTIDEKHLVDAYKAMVLIRAFDQKAIALQRTGKLGTYPSILGQEAISTAIGMTMQDADVFVPYYRDQAALYLRGVSLKEILLYWGGDERGSHYENPSCAEDMPVCVPIATQFCHAAGIASAMKVKGEKRAVVVTGGDGSTSKGDFLETLNVAGAWHLPMVIVINNNQWAISTPRAIQSVAETLAQKAIGAGIEGVVVDGNDYVGMANEISKALTKAHAGKGPTVIEAMSYRLGDHTTADDASRYRSANELKHAWNDEPVLRLQKFLVDKGWWSESQEKQLIVESKKTIEQAVEDYLQISPEPPEAMFEHLFAEIPKPILSQVSALIQHHQGGTHHE